MKVYTRRSDDDLVYGSVQASRGCCIRRLFPSVTSRLTRDNHLFVLLRFVVVIVIIMICSR